MGISLGGAIAVVLIGRAWFSVHATPLTDPETVFIVLGQVLLHPLALGFLLSAILAAIMSTISAQLLVTGSSLTEDFYRLCVRRQRSEEHTSELQSLMRISYAVFCLKKKKNYHIKLQRLSINSTI